MNRLDQRGRGERHDAFSLAWVLPLYGLLATLFFLPALLPGRQLFGTDYLGQTYFWEAFASRAFESGQLPAWMPSVYGGVPFFANPMDVYYPVSVLLRLTGLPIHLHLPILFAVQLFLAGLGMNLLMRALGTRGLSAAVAGLLYMFNGFLVSLAYGGHDNRAIVVSLLPLTFFALHGAMTTGRPRWFGLAGLVIGGALLPFQIQSSYYLLLAALLWVVALAWRERRQLPRGRLARREAGVVAALGVAFGLAAVNFVPFLGYLEHSPRGGAEGRGYDFAVTWSMPPEETVGLAVPERSGILADYVGENPFKLHMEYAGALTLLLCFVGGYVLRGRRIAWFFPALAAFALTLAYGGYTPLYRLYYEILPGISRFRAAGSAFFLVNFGLVAFAGLALDRLHRSRERLDAAPADAEGGESDEEVAELVQSGRALAVIGVVLALAWAVAVTVRGGVSLSGAPTAASYTGGVWRFALFAMACAGVLWLWLRGSVRAVPAGLLLLLLGATDLWLLDRGFRLTADAPDAYFAPDSVTEFLAAQPGVFRVHVSSDLPQDNYLVHFGIELVAGEHQNQLQSYNDFLGGSDSTFTDGRNLAFPQFLALANARYVLSGTPTGAVGEPVFRGMHRGRPVSVIANEAVLPRAFLVPRARRMASERELFERLGLPGFDPAREVLLYDHPPLPSPTSPPADPGTTPPGRAPGTAEIVERSPTEVRIHTASPDAGYLVLTDTYYPDWRAFVDGQSVPVLRAYHTFRAVPVPAGSHEVRFQFESRRLRLGFALTVATWVGLALGGAVTLSRTRARRARRRSPRGPYPGESPSEA